MVDQYLKEYAASNNDSNYRQKKKGFRLKDIVKIYRSLLALRSCHRSKKSSSKDVPNSQGSGKEMNNEDKRSMKGVGKHRNKGDESRREDSRGSASSSSNKSKSTSSSHSQSPSPIPSPTLSSSSRSMNGSRRSNTSSDNNHKVSNNNMNGFTDNLSKSSSRTHWNNINNTNGNNPNIMFSNSPGMLHDRELECTLEELCFGCTKKIQITRGFHTESGLIDQREEVLSIIVEPGWKKGTRITFEGADGAADVTFVIVEKMHSFFTREGDDLELVIEVPLGQALTGCTIPIPLLGGKEMNLRIDDIIYPGYRRIIPGQGMPNSKDQHGSRGNLKVSFLVNFPTQLTDQQRATVVHALRDSCG